MVAGVGREFMDLSNIWIAVSESCSSLHVMDDVKDFLGTSLWGERTLEQVDSNSRLRK